MISLKKSHIRTLAVILVCLVLMSLAFIIFRQLLNTKLRNTEEGHLTENAHTVSEVFYTKLDDQLTMLESQARYFKNIDLADYNEMKKTITDTQGIGEFKTIGVADPTGATIDYLNHSWGNIYLSDYFKEAMTGKNAISATTITDVDGEEVLVLAVPIRKTDESTGEETIAGVIYGTFTRDKIDDIIDSISISNDSLDIVVNADGKILAHSQDTGIPDSAKMLSDIIPNITVPQDGKANTVAFKNTDGRYIAEMIPIRLHDWYFVTILPETVVTDLTTLITIYVGFVVTVVGAVFVIILLHIRSILHRSDHFMEQASFDSLTRILNKGAFRNRFCNAMDKNPAGLAMFIIDLDNFKSVNDNLGHVMGDKVLAETADTLARIFGSRECVGRIGGDEFSAFLPCGTDIAKAAETAKTICSDIEHTYSAHGSSVRVTVSVGVAIYPANGSDYEQLYRSADKALYKVKGSGKNTYELYSEEAENDDYDKSRKN